MAGSGTQKKLPTTCATSLTKYVDVDGDKQPVADMRIFFDRRIRQDDGSYVDGGGFWVTTSLWGWRAEAAVKLLPKGARIFASGRLREESWQNDEDQEHSQLRLDADYLTVDLLCLDAMSRHTSPVRSPR